jgi:hypothetical protein
MLVEKTFETGKVPLNYSEKPYNDVCYTSLTHYTLYFFRRNFSNPFKNSRVLII